MSRLPPGPRSALLQTFAVARDPFGTFQTYARRYGDPFTLPLCTGPIVLTGTPEGIREIFTAPPEVFASNSTPFLAPLFGERSVLLVDGVAHARERAVLMPPFHGQRLQAYGRLIQEVTWRHAAAWRPGQTFRMQAFTQALALEVMLTAIFGPHDQERIQALARTIPAYFQAFTTLLVYFPPLRRTFGGVGPWRRFTHVAARVDQLLMTAIAGGGGRERSGMIFSVCCSRPAPTMARPSRMGRCETK